MADKREIQSALANIITALEVLKAEQAHLTANVSALAERIGSQNGRIGKLEHWRWMVMGGLLAVSSGVGILFLKLVLKGAL